MDKPYKTEHPIKDEQALLNYSVVVKKGARTEQEAIDDINKSHADGFKRSAAVIAEALRNG